MAASKEPLLLLWPPAIEDQIDLYRGFVEQYFPLLLPSELSGTPKETKERVHGILCDSYKGVEGSINPEFLDQLPNVRVAVTSGAGYDHLNVPLLKSRGIKVGYAGSIPAEPTSDFGVLLILAAARKLKAGLEYRFNERQNVVGLQMKEITIGIIGMGQIGYLVAKKLSGFESKILYHNRRQKPAEEENAIRATFCKNKDDLLKQADIVVVTVTRSPETIGMIGEREFNLMKTSSILVNIARGNIVQTDALVEALKSGKISGAALDVTDPEPLPEGHPLLRMRNVILTPHMAWATEKAQQEFVDVCVLNLRAGMRGEECAVPVP